MVTDDEKRAFSERLNLVLDEEGLPPKGNGRHNKLAKDWNLSANGVRKWLEADGIPETSRLIAIAKRYRVNFEWLATGRDPGTLQPCKSIVRGVSGGKDCSTESGSADARRLIRAIEAADQDGVPVAAFNVLHETLRLIQGGSAPPRPARLESEDPPP